MRKPNWPTERNPRRRGPRRPGRSHTHLDGSPRILILCEGAKTETNYFRGLKTAGRLTSVVVRPSRAGQTGPRGLWERARFELRNDPGWDEVYCVLDHDGRDSAVGDLERKLAGLNRGNRSTQIEMCAGVVRVRIRGWKYGWTESAGNFRPSAGISARLTGAPFARDFRIEVGASRHREPPP